MTTATDCCLSVIGAEGWNPKGSDFVYDNSYRNRLARRMEFVIFATNFHMARLKSVVATSPSAGRYFAAASRLQPGEFAFNIPVHRERFSRLG
jgi:hypothetical protein